MLQQFIQGPLLRERPRNGVVSQASRIFLHAHVHYREEGRGVSQVSRIFLHAHVHYGGERRGGESHKQAVFLDCLM